MTHVYDTFNYGIKWNASYINVCSTSTQPEWLAIGKRTHVLVYKNVYSKTMIWRRKIKSPRGRKESKRIFWSEIPKLLTSSLSWRDRTWNEPFIAEKLPMCLNWTAQKCGLKFLISDITDWYQIIANLFLFAFIHWLYPGHIESVVFSRWTEC